MKSQSAQGLSIRTVRDGPAFTEVRGWLNSTPLMDLRDEGLRQVAYALAPGTSTDREKAVAAHEFVRSLAMDFSFRFRPSTAGEIVRKKSADVVGRATVLVALLRFCGFPSRVLFAEPMPEALRGLPADVSALPRPVVEVLLDRHWMRIDTFIFDERYLRAAQQRLRKKREDFGYGVSAAGATQWDGKRDALILGLEQADSLHEKNPTPVDDVSEYASGLSGLQRLGLFARTLLWSMRRPKLERTIRALRATYQLKRSKRKSSRSAKARKLARLPNPA